MPVHALAGVPLRDSGVIDVLRIDLPREPGDGVLAAVDAGQLGMGSSRSSAGLVNTTSPWTVRSQWKSLAYSALRIPAGMLRVWRPTESGMPLASSSTPSSGIAGECRDVSAVPCGPFSRCEHSLNRRGSASDVTAVTSGMDSSGRSARRSSLRTATSGRSVVEKSYASALRQILSKRTQSIRPPRKPTQGSQPNDNTQFLGVLAFPDTPHIGHRDRTPCGLGAASADPVQVG